MFLNHVTAKEFVGEKYDPVVENRVAAVEAHYQDLFTKIDNEYAADLAAVQNVDSKAIVEKNKPLIEAKTVETKEYINSLKIKLREDLKTLEEAHKVNNLYIIQTVNEAYDKVYAEEMESFNIFKKIIFISYNFLHKNTLCFLLRINNISVFIFCIFSINNSKWKLIFHKHYRGDIFCILKIIWQIFFYKQ